MGLVSHGDRVSIPDSNRAIISTTVDVWDENGANLGFVSAMTRSESRPTTPIRHLDSSDAGRIVEQSPAPETVTLNFTGFALYNVGGKKSSIIHRIAQNTPIMASLNGQQLPFDLTQNTVHPATVAATVMLFLGTMLNNFTHPVNIGTVNVAETANGTVSWVENG